jgi:hypothetical protein
LRRRGGEVRGGIYYVDKITLIFFIKIQNYPYWNIKILGLFFFYQNINEEKQNACWQRQVS